MIRLILFIIIVVIFVILFSSKTKTLSKKAKIGLVSMLVLLLAVGYIHEVQNYQQNQKNQETISAFRQGKILLCEEDIEISQKDFIYISGTLSFVPNNTNTKNKGLVLELSECRVK